MRIKILLTLCLSLLTSFRVGANELNGSQISCLLEPSEKVGVSSEVPGVIEMIAGERGHLVKKGQVLIKLKSGVEQAALDLATARLDFISRKLVRNQNMYEKGLLSDHELDELVTEEHLASLEVKLGEARLKQRTVRSPIDAVVVSKENAKGEYVDEQAVIVLAALNPLHAEVIIRANQYGKITEGMKVGVRMDDDRYPIVEATVKYVDKVIDPGSGTFDIRLEMDNKDLSIPPGLKCFVDFASVDEPTNS